MRKSLINYYIAFNELCTCRSIGMSLGPIPWTAIDHYANSNGFIGPSYFQLISYVREMDNFFLDKSSK